jgi:5'-nucleotidase
MVDTSTRWFYDLPVVEGAVEGMKRLAEAADVWVCTKPLEANHYCRDGKAWWVHRHLGPEWESRLIIAPDKSMVRGDILLDDAINLDWLPRASWQPVVFPAPFNGDGSDWSCLPRWTWGDPIEHLLDYARGALVG